jgi:tetratricopeptide (TPR) repeat protein
MQSGVKVQYPMMSDRDWSRGVCSRFLKQADALLRVGKIDQALQAVEAAKRSDPSNPYCSAYLERIRLSRLEDERRNEIAESLGVARQFVSIGLVELALQRVIELLALFPACNEARALRDEIIRLLIQRHINGAAQSAA